MNGGPEASDNSRLAARVDELEIQLAHQNRMLDELNGIVTGQARQIDRLVESIGRLKERIDLLEEPGPEAEGRVKPPHY